MMNTIQKRILVLMIAVASFSVTSAAQGVLSFEDVMQFQDMGAISISDNGSWLAYELWPDRGDGTVEILNTKNKKSYSIELGASPKITSNGKWVAAYLKVPLKDQLKDKKKKLKQGLSLISTQNGETTNFDKVQKFDFTNNGEWLVVQFYQTEEVEKLKSKNKNLGTPLELRNLSTGESFEFLFVDEFEIDSLSNYIAYSVVDTSSMENGLFVFDLKTKQSRTIDASNFALYANLSWDFDTQFLAFTKALYDSSFVEANADLLLYNAPKNQLKTLVKSTSSNKDYALRTNNRLTFTNDGRRLFFGFTAADMIDSKSEKDDNEEAEIDIYNTESIIEERGLDIWHGDDPQIKTHEKKTWNSRKNHLYTAVYDLNNEKWVQLANKEIPNVSIAHNPNVVLGSSQNPYMKEMTWSGSFRDWYSINLKTGEAKSFTEKLSSRPELSPDGEFIAFYADKNWYLKDVSSGEIKNLTENSTVPFYNEDHDYPSEVPSYGVAGWTKGSKSILIYDKFDIWKFDTKTGNSSMITDGEGRKEQQIYRILSMNKPRGEAFDAKETLRLTSYNDLRKNFGFYSASINKKGVKKLLEEDKKFTFVQQPKNSDAIFYKREAYDEYPNLWMADNNNFKSTQKITHLHEDLKQKWNWGTAELIDWLSLDGTKIQGVVIKPDNYDPKKRYPIMTYYYRFFTDRLHDFNEPKTNHRPVYAQYVSDDYVVFLPDIRFEIGRPGFAATKSLVPGIQKLIEMGIADEDKLGLHGHSWSGYQTAFMVTQTDIFDAAVSGAPVSNMTSAYSGIRWASGMARQFQYEKTQSRIGESLIEAPEKYIENSPVFFADKITTPMLIMHGDADGAVPWYQSIEMYLAMRRYNKDVIFLQYHNEPHHLQQFGNKLDYAIRMKEYFDFYLKGEGEPKWIIEGEAYKGK